ncbi:hypothetical protein VNO77_01804 [Canavalia gladiata]|uniref:Uncharacterized protein n=1 Tax=Canavalia gladiata TaxID=3824 RepID=A0AAN9R6M9_CANGL
MCSLVHLCRPPIQVAIVDTPHMPNGHLLNTSLYLGLGRPVSQVRREDCAPRVLMPLCLHEELDNMLS